MRETIINAKPPLEKFKNSLSDNFKINKNLSSQELSFNTYLQSDKPQNPVKKTEISAKPKQYLTNNQPKKINNTQKDDSKKPTTEQTQDNPVAENQENIKLKETDSTTTQDTQENIDLETIGEFLINLSQMIAPLPTVNNDDKNLTGLNTDSLSAEASLSIDTHNSLPIDLTEALLNTENLDTQDTIFSTDISTDKSIDLTGFNIFPQEQLENINISADPVSQSYNPSEMMTNFTVNQSFNNNTYIQIEKASQPEVITQLPLKDNMSLSITKDIENDNKIGINLEPAGMGNVELVIETNKDNAVTAVIRSDKPEILEQLRKESASLERYLTEAGLNLGGQGLGFEHRQQQDDNKQNPNDNHHDILTANIHETGLSDTLNNTARMTTTERLYANLDKQSMKSGLDIRL
jgi:Flagellar hook-length control protein FliK